MALWECVARWDDGIDGSFSTEAREAVRATRQEGQAVTLPAASTPV